MEIKVKIPKIKNTMYWFSKKKKITHSSRHFMNWKMDLKNYPECNTERNRNHERDSKIETQRVEWKGLTNI